MHHQNELGCSASTVGIVGVGTMGGAICAKLCAAGCKVLVFDIQTAAVDAAISHGAKATNSTDDLAAASDVVLIVVANDTQLLDVVSQRFCSVLRPGASVVLHSTVHPDTCRKCQGPVKKAGAWLIDAAMSGGRGGVEAGTLLLLVGGDGIALSKVTGLFQLYAGSVIHIGPLSSGMMAKLCSNFVLHANRLALYEGIRLAVTLGLDPRRFVDAIKSGAAQSWVSAHWHELDYRVLEQGLADHQMVAQMEKDIGHLSRMAIDAGHSSKLLDIIQTELPGMARSGLRLS